MKEEQIKKITANAMDQLRDLPDDTPDRNISVVINVGKGRAYNGDHIEVVNAPDERSRDYSRAKQAAIELEEKGKAAFGICFAVLALATALLQFEATKTAGAWLAAGGFFGMLIPYAYFHQADRLRKKLYI